MLGKVKDFVKEHKEDIFWVGVGVVSGIVLIELGYAAGFIDGVEKFRPQFPEHINVERLEEAGKQFLRINGRVYLKD